MRPAVGENADPLAKPKTRQSPGHFERPPAGQAFEPWSTSYASYAAGALTRKRQMFQGTDQGIFYLPHVGAARDTHDLTKLSQWLLATCNHRRGISWLPRMVGRLVDQLRLARRNPDRWDA